MFFIDIIKSSYFIYMTDYAFCIIHFGSNKKYLEYEIYTILMLQQNTKNDIVYLYSSNDTPAEFVKAIETCKVICLPYDDKNITYELDQKDQKSVYQHFNALRTCNFLFAFQLTQYKKICKFFRCTTEFHFAFRCTPCFVVLLNRI